MSQGLRPTHWNSCAKAGFKNHRENKGCRLRAAIKEEGAKKYPDDIERYIEYKSPFIEGVYSEMGI